MCLLLVQSVVVVGSTVDRHAIVYDTKTVVVLLWYRMDAANVLL